MKVLFLYSLDDDIYSTERPLRTWTSVQFGISYLSSVLKNNKHETELLVLYSNKRQWKINLELIKKQIEDFNPKIICFTSVYSQYYFINQVAINIKKNWPDIFLIIGGVHATLNPDDVIKGPFDALCVGEGEYPLLELCNKLDDNKAILGIPNMWIKFDNNKIDKGKKNEFLENLDILPIPDRKMWKRWIKDPPNNDEISILLGRGCPYECTYCCNHALKKITNGKYVRMRSPENIIEEIKFIYNNFSQRKIYFEVESVER